MDANEYHLNQHMSKLDADEKKMQQIEDRANQLVQPGADYYPFSVENTTEALSNLKLGDSCLMTAYIKDASEHYDDQSTHVHLADFVVRVVKEYWIDAAMRKAKEEINQPTW